LLAFGLTHRPWIAHTVEKITPQKMVNPYFVAVMDGSVSPTKVKNIAGNLPGVLAISDSESNRSFGKLRALVRDLGSEYSVSDEMMNFKSLRIVLNPTLSNESLDFIRSQVVRAGGKEHISATEIKYPEVSSVMNAHPFYRFISSAGDWGVVGILALFWIISYWLCYDLFRSRSYIIEKFQRKKLVAAKTIATGLSLIFICFTALGVWNGTLKFFDLVILLMVFSVFWTFSMQDWRWKPTL
jgi:hypothetical protein